MSYHLRGLGADFIQLLTITPEKIAQQAAQRLTETPGLTTAGGFVPTTCLTLERYSEHAVPVSGTVPANTLVVWANPFSKYTDSQVNAIMNALTTAYRPSSGLSITTAVKGDRFGNFPEWVHRLWWTLPALVQGLEFFRCGWMPDSQSNQNVTRGCFWIACAWNRSTSQPQLVDFFRRLIPLAAPSIRPGTNVGALAVAGTYNPAAPPSNEQLWQGAYWAALAQGEFSAFFRTITSAAGIQKSAAQIAGPLNQMSQQVNAAHAALQSYVAIGPAVQQAIATAQTVEPAQGSQLLRNLIGQLRGLRSAIQTGIDAAPRLTEQATRIESETVRDMRSATLTSAQADVATIPFGIGRQYALCWTLKQAQEGIEQRTAALLANVRSAMEAAQVLRQPETVQSAENAILGIDRMIADLEKADADLPLSTIERHTLGVPNWGWLAIGGVAILGGMVGLKVMFKKRHVKPNRRRRVRRTR